MFKSVDGPPRPVSLEGFSYTNKKGDIEQVAFEEDVVGLQYASGGGSLSLISYEDIPKLILALQAAYDHHNNVTVPF